MFVMSFGRLQAGDATVADEAARPPVGVPFVTENEPLTLRRAAALALENNPALLAHGFAVRAAEGRRMQEGLRPAPAIGVELEDAFGSGEFSGLQGSQTTLLLSQLIELGGKRDARTGVADAQLELRRRELERARVEVLAAVAERFIHVLGDQHQIDLAADATKLAGETLALATRRVEAGRASPIEERRARIAVARARIAEEHAEHEALVSRRQLAALWGAREATFASAAGDLFDLPALPAFEDLSTRIARSPEVSNWRSEKAVRDAELKLAESRRHPDLTAGAGVRYAAGPEDVGFVFQLSMPLSFGGRQQGARAEAGAWRDKADVDQAGAELRIRTALFGFAQELLHAGTELDALEKQMLPDAEVMLQLAREGVERAGFSQLELFDAQRTLLELRQERIQAAVAYHGFIVEIEKLLGEPLSPASAQSSQTSQP